jgi:HEAT repeat protein
MRFSSPSVKADPTAEFISELRDPNWKTRWQAAQTLGELRDARAVEPLIKALDDDNQWVRIVAAEALGQIGDQRAMQPLIFGLRDHSIWVRRASVVALGQIGADEAIPPLMNRLLDPPNQNWPEELRDALARALGEIGEPAIQTLIFALDDPEPWVNCAAAQALGQIGDPEAIAPLATLTKHENRLVRSAATQALAQIADVQAVRAALSTDEAPRAFWKLMALKEIGESTVSQLKSLLGDADERIRAQAAAVLGRLGDENSTAPLISGLQPQPPAAPADEMKDVAHVRPRSAKAQSAREKPADINPLIIALRDPVAEVRLAAAEALGKIGDTDAIQALNQAMQDTDSRVRVAAARALGEIGAKQSH